jgi:hypothetical protein
MKRMMFALAMAGVTVGASGCCCCRGLFPQTVAVAPAPVACPPAAYDPCATPGVTYGTAPVGTYAPPATAYPAPTW